MVRIFVVVIDLVIRNRDAFSVSKNKVDLASARECVAGVHLLRRGRFRAEISVFDHDLLNTRAVIIAAHKHRHITEL